VGHWNVLVHRKKTIANAKPPAGLQWPFRERREASAVAPPAREAKASFTEREREIVDLLMQGMSNRQIANALGITEGTVKKHLNHIFRKLGVHSRALLIVGQKSKIR
jgi:DNA-binding CsgD family transcriptional regulator